MLPPEPLDIYGQYFHLESYEITKLKKIKEFCEILGITGGPGTQIL